ncbi:carcinine hydrolase/isopenicillin-N N-acyltransferase family protein [uncultured Gimesia sp.]|uniref:carcinine hydrolase/isopenicillin-N N-acyltransferase family protein n=1 Tax=uncultured Gimesia sp. TaxID=1678688 RepID=UPI00261EEEDE|nr:carcinine hydrolase/isopenicillin-N N-acyltransferase family protein [uncultured Gimesia sp.]
MPAIGSYLLHALLLLLLLSNSLCHTTQACTTAVISGKATVDGRPLLWKNRDTSNIHNEVVLFQEGTLRAIGVVNAGSRKSIYMGVNEAGFSIENSLSKDLRISEKTTGLANGALMKQALQTCKTVADFKKLLDQTNQTGRRTAANFGVIDAEGGAALFETGPKTYTMFDANDATDAPHGYIVRSNFATTAQDLPSIPTANEVGSIYSAERYIQACSRFDSQKAVGISAGYVIRNLTRDLSNKAGKPYPGSVNGVAKPLPTTISTDNTISRTTTVSAVVIQGVKPGEKPKLSTMWTILGNPSFSIAVPCWVNVLEVADPLTDKKGGEIGEIAITLRGWSKTADGKKINTEYLPGIWSDLWPMEDKILTRTAQAQDEWRKEGVSQEVLTKFHQKMAMLAMHAMQQELREMKQAALALPAPAPPRFAPVKKTILVP